MSIPHRHYQIRYRGGSGWVGGQPCPVLTPVPLSYSGTFTSVTIPACLSGNYTDAFPPPTETLGSSSTTTVAPEEYSLSASTRTIQGKREDIPLQNTFGSVGHIVPVAPFMTTEAWHKDHTGEDGIHQRFAYSASETGGPSLGSYKIRYDPISGARIISDSCGRVVLDFTNVEGTFQHLSGPTLIWRYPFYLNTYNTDNWPAAAGCYFTDPEMTYLPGQQISCGLIAPSAPAQEILTTAAPGPGGCEDPSQLYSVSITWGMRLQLLACSYVDPEPITYPGGPGLNGGEKDIIIEPFLNGMTCTGPAYWHTSNGGVSFTTGTWPTRCGDGSGPYSFYMQNNFGDDVSFDTFPRGNITVSDFAEGDHTLNFMQTLTLPYNAGAPAFWSEGTGYAWSSVAWNIEVRMFIRTWKDFPGYPYTSGTLGFSDYTKRDFQYALVIDNVSFDYVITPFSLT